MPYNEPEVCEWNPVESRPARVGEDPGSCQAPAMWSVLLPKRQGTMHLCESCCALPAFAGKRRKLIKTFGGARI